MTARVPHVDSDRWRARNIYTWIVNVIIPREGTLSGDQGDQEAAHGVLSLKVLHVYTVITRKMTFFMTSPYIIRDDVTRPVIIVENLIIFFLRGKAPHP